MKLINFARFVVFDDQGHYVPVYCYSDAHAFAVQVVMEDHSRITRVYDPESDHLTVYRWNFPLQHLEAIEKRFIDW